MGSVVQLDFSSRHYDKATCQAALLAHVSQRRRRESDVFWLKENAELLNVLVSTGARLSPEALEPLRRWYDSLRQRLAFFPQYYRFLLSICLDLEDLGLAGSTGAWAVDWVDAQQLVVAELSDLQRAEARRLCLRRGVDPVRDDTGLEDRLRRFAARSTTFAIPNKKAAYELTHIVFYLSDYGVRDADLPPGLTQSLRFAGTVAFLERNLDLLSEVCLALRFANQTPPAIWEEWLVRQARGFSIRSGQGAWQADDYHPYLMMQWFLSAANVGGFADVIPHGPSFFAAPRVDVSPLRELSECLFQADVTTRGDWHVMQARLQAQMSPAAWSVLEVAQEAEEFDAFFEGFARATDGHVIPGHGVAL